MKTGHLNRPKTDEIIYPIHKKIIAIENSKNVPIYFIFRTFSNSGFSVSDSHQYNTKSDQFASPICRADEICCKQCTGIYPVPLVGG